MLLLAYLLPTGGKDQVQEHLKNMEVNKSMGPDEIHGRIKCTFCKFANTRLHGAADVLGRSDVMQRDLDRFER